MKKYASVIFIIVCFAFAWDAISSEHFTIIYPNSSYHDVAISQLAILEHYRDTINSICQNKKPGRVVVYLEDIGSISNGFAAPIVNTIHNFTHIPPPSPYFGATRSWWRTVAVHEYTHISNMTLVSGMNPTLRLILGKIWQPNMYVPTWVAEGYTVYTESHIVPYEGRLNEGYYNAFAHASISGRTTPSLAELSSYMKRYPYGTGAYLWGGQSTHFRSRIFGQKALSDWAYSYGKTSFPLFTLAYHHNKAYNFSATGLWYRYLHEKSPVELSADTQPPDTIMKHDHISMFLTEGPDGLYILHPKIAFPSPFSSGGWDEIVKLSPDGETDVIITEPYISEIPIRIKGSNLYYGTPDIKRGGKNITYRGFSIIHNLWKYDLSTHKREQVFNGEINSYDFAEDGCMFWVAQYGWRGGKLYRRMPDGKDTLLWISDKLCPLDVAVSPQGKLAMLVQSEGWGKDIYLFSGNHIRKLWSTPFSESWIHFVGETLVFSANPDGKWNVFSAIPGDSIWNKLTDIQFAIDPVINGDGIYFVGVSPDGSFVGRTKQLRVAYMPDQSDTGNWQLPEKKPLFWHGEKIHNYRHLLWDPLARLPIAYATSKEAMIATLIVGMDASTARMLQWGGYAFTTADSSSWAIMGDYFSASLPPLAFEIMVSGRKNTNTQTGVMLSYPLYGSPTAWTEASITGIAEFNTNNLSKPDIMPSAQISWSLWKGKWATHLAPAITVETPKLNWKASEGTISGNFGLSRYLKFTSIDFNALGFHAFPKSTKVRFPLWCPPEEKATNGVTGSIAIYQRLFPIRIGMWSPQAYIEDVWLSPFTEAFYNIDKRKAGGACGIMLSFETHLLFDFLNILPGVGIGYRWDSGKAYYLWSIFGEINTEKVKKDNKNTPIKLVKPKFIPMKLDLKGGKEIILSPSRKRE